MMGFSGETHSRLFPVTDQNATAFTEWGLPEYFRILALHAIHPDGHLRGALP